RSPPPAGGGGGGGGGAPSPQAQTGGEAPSPGMRASAHSDLSPQAGRGEGGDQFRWTNAEREDGQLASPALYRLLTWMSPAYPVGGFSYSGGLEWAIEAGDIRDANSLT